MRTDATWDARLTPFRGAATAIQKGCRRKKDKSRRDPICGQPRSRVVSSESGSHLSVCRRTVEEMQGHSNDECGTPSRGECTANWRAFHGSVPGSGVSDRHGWTVWRVVELRATAMVFVAHPL